MTELVTFAALGCLAYWLYKNGRRDGSRRAFGVGFRRGRRSQKR